MSGTLEYPDALFGPWLFIFLAVAYAVRGWKKKDMSRFAYEMATVFCLGIAAILWHLSR